MLKFTRRALLVGAVALATVAPSAAPGADPLPCRGLSFTDEAGGAANRDIREGWFSFSGGRLTANLRLAQVDQRLETGEGSASFVMYYGVRYSGDRGRGAPAYVSARTDGTTWAFEYGDDGGGVRRGSTTGSVQAGPDGVIEIEIPSVDAAEGDAIIFVHARTFTRAPAEVTGAAKDYAPGDEDGRGYGADFPVEPCPAPQGETKPPPGSEPQPTPAPTPSPTPTPDSPSSPPGPIAPEAEAAPFTVQVPRLRARSLRRAATFKVVVDPSAPLKRLTARLSTRRGKVLARGRRGSLTRAASVKLRVRRRVVRGTYRLEISGRRADGSTVSRTVRVRVA